MVHPMFGRRCCGLVIRDGAACPICGAGAPAARSYRWGWRDRWAVLVSWAWRLADGLSYLSGVRLEGRRLVGRWNGRRVVGVSVKVSVGWWWRWRPVVGLYCGALHWFCVRSWWAWEFE